MSQQSHGDMDIRVGANTVKLTRKSHRKVRTGCSICKVRKIKCDEQKPQCGRCEKYGATCDILDAQNAYKNQKLLGPSWRPLPGPERLNMLDLELMCQWDSSTCLTFSPNPAVQNFFRRNTVTIALRCDFVALAMLSLAALHLAHECPERRAELMERSLDYHNVAARKAIDLLPIPEEPGNEEMIENLFVFSSLTVYHVISSSEQTYEILLGRAPVDDSPDWMSLFIGTSHLALASSSVHNRFSLLHPLMDHVTSMMIKRMNIRYETLMGPVYERLDSLDDSRKGAYLTAINDLDKTWAAMRQNPGARDLMNVFTWLHPTVHDLLPELRDPTPPQEALVIFCYFCIMMEEELPKAWWLGAWAEGLTQQTYDLLDDEHKGWVVRPMEFAMPESR